MKWVENFDNDLYIKQSNGDASYEGIPIPDTDSWHSWEPFSNITDSVMDLRIGDLIRLEAQAAFYAGFVKAISSLELTVTNGRPMLCTIDPISAYRVLDEPFVDRYSFSVDEASAPEKSEIVDARLVLLLRDGRVREIPLQITH